MNTNTNAKSARASRIEGQEIALCAILLHVTYATMSDETIASYRATVANIRDLAIDHYESYDESETAAFNNLHQVYVEIVRELDRNASRS